MIHRLYCYLFGHDFIPDFSGEAMDFLKLENGDWIVVNTFRSIECTRCRETRPIAFPSSFEKADGFGYASNSTQP
ncbi:hypothetical protein KW797_01390 [Candidatus Parcubacteria bacterium]|nr:hypothetical protein [Candidatus Parcubacteria bacterium]